MSASSWRRDLAWLAAALAALATWEASGLDLTLSAAWGDALGFAARHAFWSERLLHEGGRWLAWFALGALVLQAWCGERGDTLSRARRLGWLVPVLIALVLVPTLKRFSATSCPWDLARYGGSVRYVPHWLLGVADGGPGHCFPSGHAVAAFAFLPFVWRWRSTHPWRARIVLVAVLVAGALFGFAQLARGAHFASHTLWTAWLCWAVAVAWSAIDAHWLAARASEPPASRHATMRSAYRPPLQR